MQYGIYVEIKGLQEVYNKLDDIGRQGWEAAQKANAMGADYMKRVLNQSTATWRHKVTFETETLQLSYKSQAIHLHTDDPIWNMLNKGTRPHPIVAHNPSGRLWFMAGGFVPKTVPWIMQSSAGQRANSGWVSPQSVQHPGTLARHWYDSAIINYGREANKIMKDYAVNELNRIIKN